MNEVPKQEAEIAEAEVMTLYVDAEDYPDLPVEAKGLMDERVVLSVDEETGLPIRWKPVDFEPDCPAKVRKLLLQVMNGEEVTVKLHTQLMVRAVVETEMLIDKAFGDLDLGLERLFDQMPEELGKKVDAVLWYMDELEDRAARHKERAQEHYALAGTYERTQKRLKDMLVAVHLSAGEANESKSGNISYRIDIGRGKTSCFRNKYDTIVWPDGKEPTRSGKAEFVSEKDGVVTLKTDISNVYLRGLFPNLARFSVSAEPDKTAIRADDRKVTLPTGMVLKPNWVLKPPVVRKKKGE